MVETTYEVEFFGGVGDQLRRQTGFGSLRQAERYISMLRLDADIWHDFKVYEKEVSLRLVESFE